MGLRDWSFLIKSLRLWPWWLAPVSIFGTVFLTLAFWMGSKIAYSDWFENHWLYFSKTCALTAVTLMGWLLLFTTRALWTERFCRGLDRVYALHSFIGKIVFVLLCLHPLFLSLSRIPNWGSWGSFFIIPYPSPQNSYQLGANIGALSWIALIILIYCAIYLLKPYRRWHFLHQWMGVFYCLSLIHIILVERDVANYPFLFAWIWAWLLLGIGSLCWSRLYRFVGPRKQYTIEWIESDSRLIMLKITPLKDKLMFKPGQWVFLEAPSLGKERHPFSIASLPNKDGSLLFGIRIVGPWTERLQDLTKGQKIIVYGPYGMFSDVFINSRKDCVCIGAGVGITPFIGMWSLAVHTPNRVDKSGHTHKTYSSWEEFTQTWKSPNLDLFYLVNSEKDAIFDSVIQHSAISSQFIHSKKTHERGYLYHLLISNQSQYISLFDIAERVGNLKNKNILLCGPIPMIKRFKLQAKKLGIPNNQIFFEAFEWRETAIGDLMPQIGSPRK